MELFSFLKKFFNLFKKKEREPEQIIFEKDQTFLEKPKKVTKFVNKDIIVRRIQDINFIFDKQSFKEFESFIDDFHTLIVKEGYLARKQKGKNGYITFFHNWLMQNEIENFKKIHGGDVEVHHYFGKNDNRKSNLAVKTKSDHTKIHGREEEYLKELEERRKKIRESLK